MIHHQHLVVVYDTSPTLVVVYDTSPTLAKTKDSCDFCGRVDDIPHYFLKCPKVEEFWSYWIHW